jgi:hypothetical protein
LCGAQVKRALSDGFLAFLIHPLATVLQLLLLLLLLLLLPLMLLPGSLLIQVPQLAIVPAQ